MPMLNCPTSAAKAEACCNDKGECSDCDKCPLCSGKEQKTLAADQVALADKDKGDAKVPAVLNFTMKSLDGKPVNLSKRNYALDKARLSGMIRV
jgi:hypothetical protein